MYNVYNKSEIYYFWNIDTQEKHLIGNEKELIHWIAKQKDMSEKLDYYILTTTNRKRTKEIIFIGVKVI